MSRVRRLTAGALSLVTVLAFGTTTTSPAAHAAEGTTCTFEGDYTASPGLSASGSSGDVGTNPDGKVTCNGRVNGKEPTGPGTYSTKARYGTKDPDTCQSGGEGEGVSIYSIPVSDGVERIEVRFGYTYGAFKSGAPFSGEFKGERMSGTFTVQPVDGDCASKPVTKYHLKGTGTLS
jgi:hypothetical protein